MRRWSLFSGVVAIGVVGCAASGQALKVRTSASALPFTPLHSYAVGEVGDDAVFFGGISGQGLHTLTQGGGSVAFPMSVYSDKIFLVDQAAGTLLQSGVGHLPQAVREQLRCVTPGFVQYGNTLYIYGGYGPVDTPNTWTTKASVLAVDLQAVRTALHGGQPAPASAFTVLPCAEAQSAGSLIVKMGDKFALIGGSNFSGDYGLGEGNPQPFTNVYTDRVHIFDRNVSMTTPLVSFHDAYWLHRRDLNAAPVSAPAVGGGHTSGFAIACGVFNGAAPWENPAVWFDGDSSVTIFDQFIQKMNQYEGPRLSVYSESTGRNNLLLMGGLSYQVFDEKFGFYYDFLVPWVTTVSNLVYENGQFTDETIAGDTTLPMTNTHVVPRHNIPVNASGQILVDQLPHNEHRVGRVFGGLYAEAPGPEPTTWAGSTVYDVYLAVGVRGDVNKDGTTNFADLNILLGQFGTAGAGLAADLNLDGTVNFADLNVILSNFGSNTPG
ncbi:MAG: hypothetical protein AB7G17_06735 [Phycisphaerales bacterium]